MLVTILALATVVSTQDAGRALGNELPLRVRFVDLDGDGALDKLTLRADGTLCVGLNLGERRFEEPGQELPGTSVVGVLARDLDGDGHVDLYLASVHDNVALLGDGTGHFHEATDRLGLADDGVGTGVESVDIDGDGRTEVLLHNVLGDVVFWNAGGGSFQRDASMLRDAGVPEGADARSADARSGGVQRSGAAGRAYAAAQGSGSSFRPVRHAPPGASRARAGGWMPGASRMGADETPSTGSTVGGPGSPPGTVSASALASSVPSGALLLSDDPAAPPGYTDAGMRVIAKAGPVGYAPLAPLLQPRAGMAGVVWNGRPIVFGGVLNPLQSTGAVDTYDIDADLWSTLATSVPSGPTSFMGATVLDGRIYVCGGQVEGFGATDALAEYDPVANVWHTREQMVQVRAQPAVVAADGRLFVFGGSDGSSPLASVEAYDPLVDTWSPVAELPGPRQGHGAVPLDGRILICGGSDGGATNTVFAFDPLAGTYEPLAPMVRRRVDAAYAELRGKVYAFGGFDGDLADFTSSVEVYDPFTGTWAEVDGLPGELGFATALTAGDRVLLMGGSAGGPIPVDEVRAYDSGTRDLYLHRRN